MDAAQRAADRDQLEHPTGERRRTGNERKIRFPPKLKMLFRPHRYKVAYGGRGSAKSWSFARALLLQGRDRKLRILCTREVQKSIKDSVHKLLKDQIELLGLGWFYDVQDTIIRGKNGTEILFAGLSDQTELSIKSYEGVDICWCEEAQTISKSSWGILIPTIRKEVRDDTGRIIWQSEIWITFNPSLESDETYKRFVKNPPPGAAVVFINYYDNPWFTDVMEQERLHCEATEDEDTYNNIWEGMCRAAVEGAIYASEVSKALREKRITFLPYDPNLKVHTIWDMGFADHMCVLFCQRSRHGVYAIDYDQATQTTTQDMGARVKKRRYVFGRHFLPHDAFNKDRRAQADQLTDAAILEKLGFRNIKRIPVTTVEKRIKDARAQFHRFVFDKEKCDVEGASLLEGLKRYRRRESKDGRDTSPVHDEYSHPADCFGYACQCVDEMVDDDDWFSEPVETLTFEAFSSSMGY